MPITAAQLKTIVTGDESARAESLRTILNYPVLERDSQGSRFWYLRPGGNPEDAAETCPIAVGFYQGLRVVINGVFFVRDIGFCRFKIHPFSLVQHFYKMLLSKVDQSQFLLVMILAISVPKFLQQKIF
jgi:hypothetical protein